MRVDFSDWFSRPGLVARKFTYSRMAVTRDFEIEVHFDIHAGISISTFVTFIISSLDLTKETLVRMSLRALEGERPNVSLNMRARPDGSGGVIMGCVTPEDNSGCLAAFLDGKSMHFWVDSADGERLIRLPMPNDAGFRAIYEQNRKEIQATDDAEMGEDNVMGRLNRFMREVSETDIPPEAAEELSRRFQDELKQTGDTADVSKHDAPSDYSTIDDIYKRQGFEVHEFIVYPAHGVGQILAIEEQEIAGAKLELFVINFMKDKMTLRVPTAKVANVGMRKLSDPATVKRAYETLAQPPNPTGKIWPTLAQEYEAKINSGDILAIAEVIRDLYRPRPAATEHAYSEQQLYDAALGRLSREVAVVQRITEEQAVKECEAMVIASEITRRPI